jgi:uroporphyrinogen-III decarboxylase
LDLQGTQRKVFEKKATISEMAQEASYLVAQIVAQKMKSHTIAESLIMPACKIIVKTMIGKKAESETDKVPVSNNTISRHMDDMSHDTEDVLSEILTLLSKSISQRTKQVKLSFWHLYDLKTKVK